MTLAHTMGGHSGDTGTLERRISDITNTAQEITKVDTEFPSIIANINENPNLSDTDFLDVKNLHSGAKGYIKKISQSQPLLAEQERKAFEVQETALFGAIRSSYDSTEEKKWGYPKMAIEEFLFGFSDDDFMPFNNARSLDMVEFSGLESKILSSIKLFRKKEKTELEKYKTPSKEFLTNKIRELVELKNKFGAPATQFDEQIRPFVDAVEEEMAQSRYFEEVKSRLESMPGRNGEKEDWKEFVNAHTQVIKDAVLFENGNNKNGMPLEKALELISKNVFNFDINAQEFDDVTKEELQVFTGKIRFSVLHNDDKGFYESLKEYNDVLKSSSSEIVNPKSN